MIIIGIFGKFYYASRHPFNIHYLKRHSSGFKEFAVSLGGRIHVLMVTRMQCSKTLFTLRTQAKLTPGGLQDGFQNNSN